MSTTHRTLSAAALIALAGLLGGCGDDATTEAVRQADVEFTKVSSGPAAPKGYADQVYQGIDTLLTPHAGKGPKGAAEAAAVMLASAKQGQAASATEDAAAADARVRSLTRVVLAHGSEWSRLNALAEAAATYDATGELAAIDESLRRTRDELSSLEEKQRDAEARLADLDAQIESLRTRSAEDRSRAGELQLEMSQASSARGVELAPQVRDLMLSADRLELEARRVETTREQYEPHANEINLNIERVEKQRELLTRSRTETNARARAAEEDETRLRASARRAADALAEKVSELERFRKNDAQDAFDRATSLARAAVSNARTAGDAARESGNVTGAIAGQALGLLELRRAQMHLDVSNVYGAIAGLGLETPYANLRDEARDDAEAAHESATGALESAVTVMRRIRARGDAAERLTRSADMLERYARTPLGEIPDLAGAATTPPEGEAGFEGDGDASEWESSSWDEAPSDAPSTDGPSTGGPDDGEG